MADLNLVVLTGMSTKEATMRPKSSGQIKAEFSFQVDRPFVRSDGMTVSDLFLVDAWGDLAQWVCENVHQGVRLLVIGTLNKESYLTRGGGKEHLTVVKAKFVELLRECDPTASVDQDEARRDQWNQQWIHQLLETITQTISSLSRIN